MIKYIVRSTTFFFFFAHDMFYGQLLLTKVFTCVITTQVRVCRIFISQESLLVFLCNQSLPATCARQPLTYFYHYRFSCSIISYKWNDTVCTPLCMFFSVVVQCSACEIDLFIASISNCSFFLLSSIPLESLNISCYTVIW